MWFELFWVPLIVSHANTSQSGHIWLTHGQPFKKSRIWICGTCSELHSRTACWRHTQMRSADTHALDWEMDQGGGPDPQPLSAYPQGWNQWGNRPPPPPPQMSH